MKTLRPALVLTLFFAIVTGIAFPYLITTVAQATMPHQANGSMIVADGKVIGSALIGQSFADDRFFHPRPSSSGYDANNSGGTNLGPTNPKLLEGAEGFDGVKQLAEQYRALNGVPADVDLPVDAVTRSASGLDPHISVANAMLQAPRVAAKNELELEAVQQLIKGATQDPVLGIFGEPTVNVLKLNASLQERQGQP